MVKLSSAEENYLLAIHRLSDGERVSTNQLAQEIGIAPASVTDMIQKLAEKEYLRYEKYKGVSLLPIGKKIAHSLSSSTSLWKDFLINHLQLNPQESEKLLEQLQHVQSPHFAQQFKDYLENKQLSKNQQNTIFKHPEFIEDLSQETQSRVEPVKKSKVNKAISFANAIPISACEINQTYYLIGVSEQFSAATDLLQLLQLSIGCSFTIIKKIKFDQSLFVRFGDKEVLLSQPIADILLAVD